MTLALDDFFLLCTCGFLHFEPGKGANAMCWQGGSTGRKPQEGPCVRGSDNLCRANLGHGKPEDTDKRVKEKGWEVPDEHMMKTADRKEERVGQMNFFSEDLPSPRTVKLLQAKRSLRMGKDPAGPW